MFTADALPSVLGLLYVVVVATLPDATAELVLRKGFRPEIDSYSAFFENDRETATGLGGYLRERGFRVALDDFGTGFSSIGYLTSMPFDTLKIDQVFLRHSDDLMKNLSLIRSIVHLAHTLDKTVVCEGVETPVQAAALLDSGCDELQGYLFARPMPLDKLVEAYPETLRLVA